MPACAFRGPARALACASVRVCARWVCLRTSRKAPPQLGCATRLGRMKSAPCNGHIQNLHARCRTAEISSQDETLHGQVAWSPSYICAHESGAFVESCGTLRLLRLDCDETSAVRLVCSISECMLRLRV
eukprot:2560681-Pleurochrysis_carterae.AAC.1